MSISKCYSETSQLAYIPIVEEWIQEKKIPCSQTDFIFLENEQFPKSYNDSKISQQAVKLPYSLPFTHKERSYC